MRSNKLAVVTRARNIDEMANKTHPKLIEYSKRVNADFIVIDEMRIQHCSFHFEIFQIFDLLSTYDRILHIDSDVIITPACPNLFELVPRDAIGITYEDRFSAKSHRRHLIARSQDTLGQIGWSQGYVNTAVMVISKEHRKLFQHLDRSDFWNDWGYSDVTLGHRLVKGRYKIHALGLKFNFMSIFSEVGFCRFGAFIIHYAGNGFDTRKSRISQIDEDQAIFDRNNRFEIFRACVSSVSYSIARAIYRSFRKLI